MSILPDHTTAPTPSPSTVPDATGGTAAPAGLVADDVLVIRGGRLLLDHVSLALASGELVAVIGPSGAGKSTLLSVLAGTAHLNAGSVRLVSSAGEAVGEPFGSVGLVPQDDILHPDLPLGRTLQHAAALRIADRRSWAPSVERVLRRTRLTDRTAVPVRALSGGERKRACIAVELLSSPALCLLDEPTSGLDPATGRSLVATLREMVDRGAGIAFTTHALDDVAACDRVVVVAHGRIVFDGPPAQAAAAMGADDLVGVFQSLLADPAGVDARAVLAPQVRRFAGRHGTPAAGARNGRRVRRPRSLPPRPSRWRQLMVLTRRAAEIVVRNRLTAAILLGSPGAVVAMITLLFPSGLWTGSPGADGVVMESYWLAFAGFFFGLTYGLLQICSEIPVLRRERQSGVSDVAYLGSKAVLLTPVLMVVNVALLGVLAGFDRLPALDAVEWLQLFVTMQLNAMAALALGLLASALVGSAAQAALALPMLCFPAVLFSGAMVPVTLMTGAAQGLAQVVPDRWAFEAIARHLEVHRFLPAGSAYADLGRSGCGTYWSVLLLTGSLLAMTAYLAVRRRSR